MFFLWSYNFFQLPPFIINMFLNGKINNRSLLKMAERGKNDNKKKEKRERKKKNISLFFFFVLFLNELFVFPLERQNNWRTQKRKKTHQ